MGTLHRGRRRDLGEGPDGSSSPINPPILERPRAPRFQGGPPAPQLSREQSGIRFPALHQVLQIPDLPYANSCVTRRRSDGMGLPRFPQLAFRRLVRRLRSCPCPKRKRANKPPFLGRELRHLLLPPTCTGRPQALVAPTALRAEEYPSLARSSLSRADRTLSFRLAGWSVARWKANRLILQDRRPQLAHVQKGQGQSNSASASQAFRKMSTSNLPGERQRCQDCRSGDSDPFNERRLR
jgi:hypothetical protein